MAQSSPEASVIKAYWQPGCTSCLRMKEFLTKHGVPFVSVNVLEDKDAFAELAMLGIRSVPIVRRGKDWANGQVLREVARVAGIAWGGAHVLPARAGRTAPRDPNGGGVALRANPRRQARPHAAASATQLSSKPIKCSVFLPVSIPTVRATTASVFRDMAMCSSCF
jgi:glutaredoxin